MPVVKSIEQLRRELEQKEEMLAKLSVYRDRLQEELDRVSRQIDQLQGKAVRAGKPGRKPKAAGKASAGTAKAGAPAKRGRRRDGKSLVDYIKQVLADKPEGLRVRDIATEVKNAGYKSAAKDFYTIVAAAARDPKSFKKTGRGVYKLA